MAHIHLEFEDSEREHEVTHMLGIAHVCLGGIVTEVSALTWEYHIENPKACIDILIQAEVIDPTRDVYVIHD